VSEIPAEPAAPPAPPPSHPVRLVVTDDLRRSRLTVFFRFLLAIPHYLWAALMATAVVVVVFLQWWVLLFRGRPAEGLRDFTAGFIRYATHIEAYVLLAANPYPGFFPMAEGPYPVDLEIDPAAPQNRWKTVFRLLLAVPAMLISAALLWGGSSRGSSFSGGLAFSSAFLLWWVGLFRGRASRGLRDQVAYCIGYAAQLSAYLFLVTDRYPYSGPNAFAQPRDDDEPHPVRLTVADDLRRSRLLVFFRLPIAIPHIVWYVLWSIVALMVSLLNWLWALAAGRPLPAFHRFLSAYVRYGTHLSAFLLLVGNPFPGFVGKSGSYPIELELPAEPERQRRLVTLFRLLLAVPAWIVSGGLWGAAGVAAFLAWFAALVRGQMPDGLRNLSAYALRYSSQVSAYSFLLTERYPDAGPRPDPTSP
jgi:Domain of unknown function (DUF4389)